VCLDDVKDVFCVNEHSGERMRHETGLPLLMELVIDVTPQIHSPNKVINACVEFLESHGVDSESVHTFSLLLSEALANAIEHGVLRLPSSLKENPCGDHVHEARSIANDAESGQVLLTVKLLHENGNSNSINAISVEVADSGPGFDWRGRMSDTTMPAHDKPYGRGLALIKTVASQISFNEAGNIIQFVIQLQRSNS